jgi:HTH-type transcriptional regulator, glycine betaine synthesis regulator
MFGLPRSYGEIYGLLYASARPLSFTDIQERLDVSKGSVSPGLKALREVGAIRQAQGSDPRREHFEAETELRALLSGFLKESIVPQLQRGSGRIATMKSAHRATLVAKNGDGRLLQSRLDKLQSWHRKGGALLPLISKFLG